MPASNVPLISLLKMRGEKSGRASRREVAVNSVGGLIRKLLSGEARYGRLLSLTLLKSVMEGILTVWNDLGLVDPDSAAKEATHQLESALEKILERIKEEKSQNNIDSEELKVESWALVELVTMEVRRNAAMELGDLLNLALELAETYPDSKGVVNETRKVLANPLWLDNNTIQTIKDLINQIDNLIDSILVNEEARRAPA